jgi:hypothetical protein
VRRDTGVLELPTPLYPGARLRVSVPRSPLLDLPRLRRDWLIPSVAVRRRIGRLHLPVGYVCEQAPPLVQLSVGVRILVPRPVRL